MAEQSNPVSQWDEFKLLYDCNGKVMQYFLTWTAWFYGANLIAIGYVFHDAKDYSAIFVQLPLIVFMIFADVLAVVGILPVATLSKNVQSRSLRLIDGINVEQQNDIVAENLLPLGMNRSIIKGSLAGVVGMALLWSYIASKVILEYSPPSVVKMDHGAAVTKSPKSVTEPAR